MKSKLLEFIGSLLSSVNRDDVAEDMRLTTEELSRLVVPAYQEAANTAMVVKLKSDQAKRLTSAAVSGLESKGFKGQASWAGDVLLRLRNAAVNAELVARLVDSDLESVVIPEGMSSRKAVLLRMAGVASFVSRYSLEFLNYVLLLERAVTEGDHVLSLMAPIVRKRIESQVRHFSAGLNDIGLDPKEFASRFKDLEDILINQRNAQAVLGAVDLRRFDPFNSTSAIVGFAWSPVLMLRLPFAQWQDSRHRKNKETLAMLQTQLQILTEDNQRNPNPNLERTVKYYSDRIGKLERQIADYESDLAD